MTLGIRGGVSSPHTASASPGSHSALPGGAERPPESPRLARSNALPLRSRTSRLPVSQQMNHSANVDAHGPADSGKDDGVADKPTAARFRMVGGDARAAHRAAKFVPTLSPVIEEAAQPQPQATTPAPTSPGPLPPPRQRLSFPTPLTPPTPVPKAPASHGEAAAGSAATVDVNAQAVAGARADAMSQIEAQQQLQAISSTLELHKALAELAKKGASILSAGV
jgi:hypothetical protein